MNEFSRAREIALRMLDTAPRTRAEIVRRLTRAEVDEETREAVIADLERVGFLDDAQFSRDWVESRFRNKRLGSARLSSELLRKGIDREQVEEAVADLDPETELSAALELARRRLPDGAPDDPAARRRLAGYLQRRGYKWEIIEQVFNTLFTNRG